MLDKKYNHLKVEQGKYEIWKEKGYFKSGDNNNPPYTIVIPPPNVTGKLHIGHAWDTAIQDIMIRFKKLEGYDTLWVPGMDHAGISTQAKVDKRLREQGIDPRSMERDEWLKAAWAWKDEYAENIHKQWAKLGLALDYSKERFTLDEGLSKAVKHVFITLYNKGLIYRGERIINWDPVQMTALSNEEVIYRDEEGAFYHLKYFIENSNEYLDVATTRPETLFGDTAVAVNPNDERYKHLIGKKVILPVLHKAIPIIADEHADMEKGTGVVKITPAHDPNDFEVGERHNLEKLIIMNPDATMNEKCGKYQSMNRYECREKLVEDLKEQDLLIDIEKITHSVGHSERSDAVVEPYLSKQWFVKMDMLAKRALNNQLNNKTKVSLHPERFEKLLNHWLEITHDWCISRQLWWGHRIPAYYKGDEVYVGLEAPGEDWVQDSDTLDTWFSSALWPFSTLGWPDNTELLNRYYPNDLLVAGFDIIFFWVSRMIFQALEFTDTIPFKDCLIHGLVRDAEGRKMSKSLGNGVDPMDEIEKYGADSLRFFLTTSSAPGMDVKYDEKKVKSTWNFVNKIWNASRYVLMNIEEEYEEDFANLSLADKWILNKLNETIKTVVYHMDKYEFNLVGSELYSFIWNDFCDWYIELSKTNMNNSAKTTLVYILKAILKMLHPFMPYVTEEIYLNLPKVEESIMLSTYPQYKEEFNFAEAKNMEEIIEFIKKIRKIKLENNVKNVYIETEDKLLQDNMPLLRKMLKLKDGDYQELSFETVSFMKDEVKVYYDNLIDETKEIEALYREKEKLTSSIERRKKLLANENYVSKAPQNIVDNERKQLEKEENELKVILEKLS